MSTSNSDLVVQPGTDVYGSDGEKIGKVDTIEGDYLVLRKGFFFPKDHYIPFSAISGHTGDRIDLNVSSEQATNQDWDHVPTGTTTTTTSYAANDLDRVPGSGVTESIGVDNTIRTGSATTVETTAPVDEVDTVPFEHRTGGTAHYETTEDIRLPVVEEELTATKRGVERGAVRVETHVIEREETLSVPVSEERVHIERVAVDREATAADLGLEGKTIDVPLYGEEVEMGKRARVVEEVAISKDVVQETRQVSGTVRREDVEVIDTTVSATETTTGMVPGTQTDPDRRGS